MCACSFGAIDRRADVDTIVGLFVAHICGVEVHTKCHADAWGKSCEVGKCINEHEAGQIYASAA